MTARKYNTCTACIVDDYRPVDFRNNTKSYSLQAFTIENAMSRLDREGSIVHRLSRGELQEVKQNEILCFLDSVVLLFPSSCRRLFQRMEAVVLARKEGETGRGIRLSQRGNPISRQISRSGGIVVPENVLG